ncbi:MAG: type IX secretion system sortase PorU [Tannerellaceae bacterium]|jgi:hypothetical protein|nr:type IX secretion system sortase PorU [Tannerellaceae bacterium]
MKLEAEDMKACGRIFGKQMMAMAIALTAMLSLMQLQAQTKSEGYAEVDRSAMASGLWVRIQISQSGIYKITYDEMRKMGFDDPAKVSVHGYGGWPLNEDFSQPIEIDLPPVGIYRGDSYIIFYGKGPIRWEYNPTSYSFAHVNNPYATYGCYFLTDATEPQDMQSSPLMNAGAALTISTYDEYRLHEEELFSPNESGRELYGESFAGGGSRTISAPAFNIPGVTDEDGLATMSFIARPRSAPGTASLSIDGKELISFTFQPVSNEGNYVYLKARERSETFPWTGSKTATPAISVAYNRGGDENVHLNYIRLQLKRTLAQYGEYTFFRSIASANNISRFVLRQATGNTLVFDITDGNNPLLMETELSGSELSFVIPAGSLREFVAVEVDKPLGGWQQSPGETPNQDLHGMGPTDMVIIAQPALIPQAERLAERHRADGLRVSVIDPQKIYNEFSSGTPDATAYRRLMKRLYDRATTIEDRPRYLLLFGDGAYDNRKLTAAWKQVNTANMLLTYQSVNSLDHSSYVTDDYFGALDDSRFTTGPLRLGIGRFPVRTLSEAVTVVDKVLAYMDNKETGEWKNRLCFVADDGSAGDGYSLMHADSANNIADALRAAHPEVIVSKLYFDAYKKTGSAYPDIRDQIRKQLNDGLLAINYMGHGDTEKWSDESVLTAQDIARFTHTRLPLWITATCDFTRFDHTKYTAGENVFLQKSGGIAMLTTTRVVYAAENASLNNRLAQELFRRDENGKPPALGDVMRLTKSALNETNKFNFILIGDPAMPLAYPDNNIRVTAINGNPVSPFNPAAFRALDKIRVEGEITDSNGNRLSDFNGSINATVFDSRQTRSTLDNNRTGERLSFTDYPNRLYVGNDLVQSGTFSFSFTVPKDISYSNNYGLMNLYAVSDQHREANGSFDNFTAGGSSEIPPDDTEGPQIRLLYLNDSTFTEGGTVNSTPLFVARIWDETGVNIGGGSIGHDLSLAIDNKPATTYTLNSYYRLIPESSGEGIVQFSVPELTPGLHTAEFRVWDVMNNPTLHSFSFNVSASLKPSIIAITASPVPARSSLQFRIDHNMPESSLNLRISVYDVNGKLQWAIDKTTTSAPGEPIILDWNLADSNNRRMHPGVYIYKVSLRTAASGESSKSNKLVILAQ